MLSNSSQNPVGLHGALRGRIKIGLTACTLLAACGQDFKVSESAKCNGRLEGTEATVDSPFDADLDGYFDGGNPDCQATYAETLWDCNDQDEDINPGQPELACNGVDDDCDESTLDSDDADLDGYDSCTDCADSVPEVNPGQAEVACDGLDNDCDDATVDEVDADADGYGSCTDCADADPSVSPGTAEITCNGVDDDCNDVTSDGPDVDADGESSCTDCDDLDGARSNTFTEVCDDEIDNDCDGEVDDGCDVDYTGIYIITPSASYSCAYGIVSINVSTLTVADARPVIAFAASGSQPGTMTGSLDSFDAFTTSNVLSGSCTETYTFDGSFTGPDTFTGTLTAAYSGSCFDCRTQTWTLDGAR